MNSKADDGSKVIRNLSDLFNSLKAKNKKKKIKSTLNGYLSTEVAYKIQKKLQRLTKRKKKST